VLIVAAACGGGSTREPGGERAAAEVSLEARAAAEDLVVARVDGVPVYGSCVAAQIAGGEAADRAAAVAQCVDFELLAQEAARRGYVATGEVGDARKREAVRRFVVAEYAGTIRSFDDLPTEVTARALAKARELAELPEFREAVYVRAPALDVPSGSPDDLWAKGLAEEIHAALAGKTDLTADQFRAIASEVAHGRMIESGKPFSFSRHGRAVEEFAAATFAIPAVGMVSQPTKTKWGWDVILLTRLRPKSDKTDDQIKAELFPELRKAYFNVWAHRFSKDLEILVDEDRLTELVEAAP
jgi:hypothetical protein